MINNDAEPKILINFSEVAGNYHGCIIDLWGVVHDGRQPFALSQQVMANLRAMGKKVCLLSNAPSRVGFIKQHLAAMGITEYDFVMTSGELVWQGLKERIYPEFAGLGQKCFIMSAPGDYAAAMLHGLDLRLCQHVDEADFVWCVQAPLADYGALLKKMLERNLPLICANPDLEVLFNGELVPCPGALAQQYQQLGGRVIYRGKPFAHGYQACIDFCGSAKLAAIGDGMLTDILGAARMGLDSYFVATGIHGATLQVDTAGMPSPLQLRKLFKKCGVSPTATMPCLRW